MIDIKIKNVIKTKDIVKKSLLILICLFSITMLTSCKQEEVEVKEKYDDISSLNGKPFSIVVGTVHDQEAKEFFPKSEQLFFSSVSDCVSALKEGKVEATMFDESIAIEVCNKNDDLTCLSDRLAVYKYSAIATKNDEGTKRVEDFNKYLHETYTDEQLKQMYTDWQLATVYSQFEYEELPNINGSLTFATDASSFPFVFSNSGRYTGLEIELFYGYCKSRGYAMNIEVYDFAGVLSAVQAGKADFGISAIIETEERAKSVLFTDAYAEGGCVVVIRKENSTLKYNIIQELNYKQIGLVSGGTYDMYAAKKLKEPQFYYFNSTADVLKALSSNKIEAAVLSSAVYTDNLKNRKDIKAIGDVGFDQIAFIMPKENKSEKLKAQLDEFIFESKENGNLDSWYKEWYLDELDREVDYDGLTDVNGTLNVAVCSDIGAPSAFVSNNKLVGMDIEILVEFAKKYGYNLNFEDYSFSGMLTAVSMGMADLGGSNISITEERKQSVLFSEPFVDGKILVIVKSHTPTTKNANFFDSIKASFNRTFIEENRYELYLNGIKTTFFLTIASAAFGTILGIVLFYIFKQNMAVTNKLLKLYTWLVNGLPTVVLLMVFYYIILGQSDLSGIWVSIIAFTVLFSVSTFGLLNTCFMAIDKGQFEASYALGYSKRKTITNIIIPQIAPMFLPTYRSELVSLAKATSIVGYIAVQDLTKITDIVRSRTYEAFFPLIATTVLYFLITGIINIVIKFLEDKLDPKRRELKEILKGVDEE